MQKLPNKRARKHGGKTRSKRARCQRRAHLRDLGLQIASTRPCPVSIASKKTIWSQKRSAQTILNHELFLDHVGEIGSKNSWQLLFRWTHSPLYIISGMVIEQQTKNSETLAANPRKRRKETKNLVPNIYYKGSLIIFPQRHVMF